MRKIKRRKKSGPGQSKKIAELRERQESVDINYMLLGGHTELALHHHYQTSNLLQQISSVTENISVAPYWHRLWTIIQIKGGGWQHLTSKFLQEQFPTLSASSMLRYDNILQSEDLLEKQTQTTTEGKQSFYRIPKRLPLKFANVNLTLGEQGGSIGEGLTSNCVLPSIYNTSNNIFNIKNIKNQKKHKTLEDNEDDESINIVEARHQKILDKNKFKVPLKYKHKVKEIINYWSRQGKPFAKVKKPCSIEMRLCRLLNINKGRTEPIVKVFKTAAPILSSSKFRFAKKTNWTLSEFINPPNLKNPFGAWLHDYKSQNGDGQKLKTMFDIFELRSQDWIGANLLNLPRMKKEEKELAEILLRILPFRNAGDFQKEESCAYAAKKWFKIKEANPNAALNSGDLESFVNQLQTTKYMDSPHYYGQKSFWNNFARYVGQVRGYPVATL